MSWSPLSAACVSRVARQTELTRVQFHTKQKSRLTSSAWPVRVSSSAWRGSRYGSGCVRSTRRMHARTSRSEHLPHLCRQASPLEYRICIVANERALLDVEAALVLLRRSDRLGETMAAARAGRRGCAARWAKGALRLEGPARETGGRRDGGRSDGRGPPCARARPRRRARGREHGRC